jgi:sulfite reductase (NADPH) flavoprotein alpha-component
LKNFWFQAHWLVGITAGIVLAIVGTTGSILSFEDEIQEWMNRDVRRVEAPGATPLTPSALLARLQEQQPAARISSMQLSDDPEASIRVNLGGQSTRYANPYTGELLAGEANRGREFFRNTRSLHRYLVAGTFGNRDIGKHIVGASTLLCAALTLTGLYLRWPRRAGNWRTWLTFDLSLKGRPFLWHLHAIVGTWVLAIFLVMSLTGPYWSYNWYRNGLYALSGVERPPERRNEGARNNAERPRQVMPPVNLDAAWSSFGTATAAQGFSTATLNLPQETGRPVEIRYVDKDPAHSRAHNTLALDATTGATQRHERYDDKPAGGRFMSSMLAWHSGSVFGVAGKVLFMLATLCMPLFAITGWMMYLQRRRRQKLLRRKG